MQGNRTLIAVCAGMICMTALAIFKIVPGDEVLKWIAGIFGTGVLKWVSEGMLAAQPPGMPK